MKTMKKIIMSTFLCFALIVPVFALTGCGETSVSTLGESFDALDAQVAAMTEAGIFSSDTNTFGIETKYKVSYGQSMVEDYVSYGVNNNTTYQDYGELQTLYNATLVIANDYTDDYKDWIITYFDTHSVSSSAQTAINNLNSSVQTYISNLKKFVTERSTLISNFNNFGQTASDTDKLSYLLQFKKVYGAVVQSAVDVSEKTAALIDATQIYDIIKSSQVTESDFKALQEYVSAKLLQIYSRLCIVEISNNMNWTAAKSATTETETSDRIDAIITNMKTNFTNYKSSLVTSTTSVSVSNQDTCNELFNEILDKLDEFLVEVNAYTQALNGLNLKSLATTYSCNLTNYLKSNSMAEVYLEKIEQFTNISLPNFVTYVSGALATSA